MIIFKLLGVDNMSQKKTYRITYLEKMQRHVDIVADNHDEALQGFDMETFDTSRVVTIQSLGKAFQGAKELGFDVFKEIDAINAHYEYKIGGTD